MGYLWENMEKMDIQLERRNTAEQRQRAEKAEQKAEKAEQKAREAERKEQNAYRVLISDYQRRGISKEAAAELLRAEAGIEEGEVSELLKLYWMD